MSQNASILLIYPPCTKAGEPPAGVARLAGALSMAGRRVGLIDANLEGQLFLLAQTPAETDTWTVRALKRREEDLVALRTMKTYQDLDWYRRSCANLGRLLALAGPADVDVSLADYRDRRLSPIRSGDLRTSFSEFEANVFFPYFSRRLDELVAGYDQVGFSLCFLNQALCAFAMAGYVRRRWPRKRLVLGGSLITSWVRKGKCFPLDLFDQVIAGPGEQALCGRTGNGMPDFAPPDYLELYRNDYLSPGRVLPYSASDGCYWNRCAFCPEKAEGNPHRQNHPEVVLRQLVALCRRHEPALIHLLDNAIAPALLDALAADPPGVPWYGFVRATRKLTDPAYCRRLRAAGCVMLKLGIESGDQTVLDAMHKGIVLKDVARVLENLKAAGIGVYAYLLFGTPAEDEAAAMRTLDFAAAHADCIDFLNLAIFNLPDGSALAEGLTTDSFYAGDLSLYTDFVHPRGWDRRRVRRFLDRIFRRHARLAPIIRNDPPCFSSNHAPFFLMNRAQKGL